MKQGETSDKIYQRLRSTGSQPARLYVLAKVHEKDTPLRPVFSIPACSFENLNRFLTPFFQKLPGANIATNTQDARKALESLEDKEQIVSLDLKILYTNVPVREVLEIALKRTLFKQPSSRDPKVCNEKFVKACGGKCLF